MTDRYDHDLLLAHLEGDLAPGDRAKVDVMLADEPQLAALMRDMAGDRELLRSMPNEPAPGDLSFDLVQGLERRMLLDAPQIEGVGGQSGPIPISRGRREPRSATGVRWSRVLGVGSMAAAVALAAGLVIYVNQTDPLSRTAFEMADQPANESAGASAGIADSDAARDADEGLSSAEMSPGGVGTRPEALNTNRAADQDGRTLAERARHAFLNSGRDNTASASPDGPAPGRIATPALAEAPQVQPRVASNNAPMLALTAYAPERALRIASDNPDLTREQVVNWAVNNGVPVVEPQAAGAANGAAPQEQLALLIEEDQLDKLIEVVNQIDPAPFANQRAEIGAVDVEIYGQAALVADADTAHDDAAHETADLQADPGAADPAVAAAPPAQPATQAVVSLKVPEDLGDAFLNRQNVANTYQYTNQDELALVAQRDAEVLRNQRQHAQRAPGVAPGTVASDGSARPDALAGVDPAGDPSIGGTGAGAGGAALPREEFNPPADRNARGGGERRQADAGDTPAEESAQPLELELDAAEALVDGDESPDDMRESENERAEDVDENSRFAAAGEGEDAEFRQPADTENSGPATRRGNWLMPQIPLADSAPIWTQPPSARLVPVVFILQQLRRGPIEAAESEESAPVETQADPETVQPQPAPDEPSPDAPADSPAQGAEPTDE